MARDLVIMGDHKDGFAGGVELTENRENLPALGRIQVSRGLIGQQQQRLHSQSPGDGGPLQLAAGKL